MDIMKFLGFSLFFASFLVLARALVPKKETTVLKDKLAETELSVEDMSEGAQFIRLFKPFIILTIPVISLLPLESYFQRIKLYLIYAGMEDDVSEKEFVGFQIVIALIFMGVAMFSFQDGVMKTAALLIGGGYPYIWLNEKVKKRQEAIRRSMPDTIDMLSLSVEAGLDFFGAVNEVIKISGKKRYSLAVELHRMIKNIQLGMTREEALKMLARRVNIMELNSFVTTLVQSEKMGTSIAVILKDQAVRMREERFMRAEQLGAIASQKLLVPTVFLIFPVVFMIIFAPLVLQYLFR